MPPYTIHPLPKSHPNPSTWTRILASHKHLRLTSLLLSPSAFSSTHAREAAFTHAEWDARLRNPLAVTFVAVSPSPSPLDGREDVVEDEDPVASGENWIGTTVLYGPLDASTTSTEVAASTPVTFEIFALFVVPEARGKGVGRGLVAAAVECAKGVARERGVEGFVRIAAAGGNERAIGVYEGLGFRREEVEEGGEGEGDGTVRMVVGV
ncbi:hypothetical protein BU24DRAFT_458539 [Aaosphaeria arxii CBS 175.79]|uniref:N-acetyltransferase domain-containing protein n=1 Tax=Aaosphaeria arxii CBS 175.79 TaxID=1450172 RepID=A0A6A5Y2K0_9PLEO|nr:uncharacterized protein BU24DRAFT_458539 [Aaosphaeria arxii CBS 175.79]KAF2018804.1 hypothetical protein BU24DRAFT_458539 [Aaosphaeria arxii CBS 175.79]